MYVPEVFSLDAAAAGALVRDNSFGLLVTVSAQGLPQASHLPFLFEETAGEPQGRLLGHMARANPQWHDLAALAASDGEALVVFQGAQADQGEGGRRDPGPGDGVDDHPVRYRRGELGRPAKMAG